MNTYAREKGVRISKVIEEINDADIELTQVNYKNISSLLNSDIFYCKISFLSLIINRLNGYNKAFQSQSLDISQLKANIYECFSSVLELFIIPQKLNLQNLRSYFAINWMNPENYDIWFHNSNDFVKKLKTEYPSQLNKLKNLTQAPEEHFTQIFRIFIAKILDLMTYYLPLENSVIETFDFIQDINNFGDLLNKSLEFNNYFKILDDLQISNLKEEILKLTSQKRSKYEHGATNMIEVWDRIEEDMTSGFQFTLLPKLAKIAQSLPTSSSDVEQIFSGIKLIKTLLRNRLSAEKIESILLIIQAYSGKKQIEIDNNLLKLHQDLSKFYSEKKRGKIRSSPSLVERSKTEEEIKESLAIFEEKLNEDEDFDGELAVWDNQIFEDELKFEAIKTKGGLKKMKNN